MMNASSIKSWASGKQWRVLMGLIAGVWIWLAWPLSVRAADTIPPTMPGKFQATVVSRDPAVTLSWAAATDASGIKAYRVDRSLDQSNWKTLSAAITELTYRDTTSGFGLHYYYRLSAIDTAGNVSVWTLADVAIEGTGSSTTGSSAITYTSRDTLAAASLPAGLAAAEMSCTLDSLSDASGRKAGTQKQPVVLGPYQLACKTLAGSVVVDYKKMVSWTFDLKGKLKGLRNPAVYALDSEGHTTLVKSQFDAKNEMMKADLAPASIAVVKASVPPGFSLSFLMIILVLTGVIGGVVVLIMNGRKKLAYDEYLRSKYYEL